MDEVNTVYEKRKKAAIIIFAIIGLVGAIAIYFYLTYKAAHITTEDAFVEGRIHTIASKVPGTVKAVYVKDNQPVKKGDLLIEIDEADYDVKTNEASSGVDVERAKLSEVDAKIDASKKRLSEMKARMEAQKANLELQEASLRQAELDIKRAEVLYRKDAVSKERFEKTKTSYDVAIAQVKAAKEQLRQAEMGVETQKAVVKQTESAKVSQSSTVKQKEAALKAARLNFGYAKIYAPSDGHVTRKSVETGNQIQAGQPLMAVVPLDDIWVTANYKETQLEKIKPGQKVEIKIDSYSGKTFKGTVDSIMAGTGAVFSLFPPENATGNYVKVVQRIPVKIVLDKDGDPQHILRVGMSVEPTVIVGK